MSFTNTNKSASPSFSTTSKNSSAFLTILKHGQEPTLQDLANFTFNDVIFNDGTILKNVTFDQLASIAWSLVNKS